MRGAIRIATVTVASLALAMGSATAASASSDTIKDKRSDVVLKGKVGGHRTASQKSAAAKRDVTGLTVSHGSKYVSVKIAFANLERHSTSEGSGYYEAKIEFARKSLTNMTGKVIPSFEVDQYVSDVPGMARIYEGEFKQVCGRELITDGDGPYTAESYIKSDVKFGKNGYIKVQVPRSCVGSESKIKVRATVYGNNGSKDMFYDYVSPSTFKTPAWTEWLLKG